MKKTLLLLIIIQTLAYTECKGQVCDSIDYWLAQIRDSTITDSAQRRSITEHYFDCMHYQWRKPVKTKPSILDSVQTLIRTARLINERVFTDLSKVVLDKTVDKYYRYDALIEINNLGTFKSDSFLIDCLGSVCCLTDISKGDDWDTMEFVDPSYTILIQRWRDYTLIAPLLSVLSKSKIKKSERTIDMSVTYFKILAKIFDEITLKYWLNYQIQINDGEEILHDNLQQIQKHYKNRKSIGF